MSSMAKIVAGACWEQYILETMTRARGARRARIGRQGENQGSEDIMKNVYIRKSASGIIFPEGN